MLFANAELQSTGVTFIDDRELSDSTQHAVTSNQSMELTASRHYDLHSADLNLYPVAVRVPARGSSSWSR
jgi:hypothetical protein